MIPFLQKFIQKIFRRQPTGNGQLDRMDNLTDIEKLRLAEQTIQQKRADEAAFLKSQPKKNTDPHSFGYIPNPFRDTQP